ncbi:MAG: O-antigen ligase family protein, partial [Kiritimatiellae bacterium]|nr:O-antigen ligase family protein [Kiritimatiellia bacterium]
EHKLFGVGGWGYVHFCLPMMTPEERDDVQMVGGINVHNDYLQFLAEHGVVGFGALVTMVVLLVWPVGHVWRRMARKTRFMKPKDLPPKPVQIFVLPAPAFCLLVAITCTLVHAFGDCPLRSPAVLTLFFVTLAAMPGFLPEKGN